VSDPQQTLTFELFVEAKEKGLRYALIAMFGIEDGRDAAAHALLYGWENWPRLQEMSNPAGYLYRVGQTWGHRNGHRTKTFPVIDEHREPWVEPRLAQALDSLPEDQRVAVVMRHGADCSYEHIAELLETSAGAVRKKVERALHRLRVTLEVSHES